MNDITVNPILNDEQKSFLRAFSEWPYHGRYYLSGGTALAAFYLGHRFSEDLDFFAEEPVDIEPIFAFLRSLANFEEIQYDHKFDRRIFLLRSRKGKTLNVEFTLYPFKQVEPPTLIEGIQIDSVTDILANKLTAMTDRYDLKDYVDTYFAFKRFPALVVDDIVRLAEGKFGISGVRDLLRGRFLQALPAAGILKMRETLDLAAIADFFAAQAKAWISRSITGES